MEDEALPQKQRDWVKVCLWKTDALPSLLFSGFYPNVGSGMLAGRVILS